MARLKNYTRSLASGYILLGVNIAYSLGMVPLALSYLSKPVFGIWGVVVQIGVFLQLTDLGMTGAFSRILIEYKDSPNRSDYASVIKTMWIVFCLQGLAIALLGWVASPLMGEAFRIEAEYQALFVDFMRVYLVIFGITISLKVFELILSAHQRNDLVNLGAMIGFVANFIGLWLGFRAGWGLWAMVAGFVAMAVVNISMNMWQVWRINLIPAHLIGVAFSRARFFEVFDYGKDRFLVSAGSSLLQATPTFLVTRFLGLEANAAWTIGTRAYYLCVQLVGRFSDFAYPAIAEMYVRREMGRLKDRFISLLEISILVAGALGVGLAFFNSEFVDIWTGGKIVWDPGLDPLLGLWLIMVMLRKVAWLPVGASRTLGFMRFVDSLEAVMMIVLVMILLHWIHSPLGVLLGILAASLMGGAPYCILRGGQILNSSALELLQRPARSLLTCAVPMALGGFTMTLVHWPHGLAGLAIRGCLLGILGTALVLVQSRFLNLTKDVLRNLSGHG